MSHPTDANCIFCKIVAGQIPSFKLLEDDKTIAFMDINPVNPGHSLSVAKGHWPMVDTIPTDVLGAVAATLAPEMAASGFVAQADAIEEALGVMVGAGFDAATA